MDQSSAVLIQASTVDRTMSKLNNSIGTIRFAKGLIPLELGKGVLSGVESILVLVRDTIKNKDDFAELVSQCHQIVFVLWRATSGTPEYEISEPTNRALVDLQASVDDIKGSLKVQGNRGVGSRMFHVAIDREQIAAWTRDLDRFLLLFNTELNITNNLKLEEISKDLRNARLIETKKHPVRIPGIPAIFFGRNEIVKEVVNLLISGQHVALIGPGGMGKSCIARVVLHDHAISEKFTTHRYFVRYDDMNPSHVTLSTFLDRIARTLGIKSSRADQLGVISSFLGSHEVLLALDNAEAFLDAATDTGQIADIVDELAALPGVALMLTTRTKALPANLLCTKISVPPLDEPSALATFSAIYQAILPSEVTKRLLLALDFHPLSINLLAQACSQNEWSPEKLVASWEHQKANLLEIGQGKVLSLAVTLELSLNTPSLQSLGSSVLQFLQIAAFLPQGVDERKLGDLFPGISDINILVSKLTKQSLVYHSGNFITMLAPIRLYISSKYNAVPSSIVLLKHIRTYYRDCLARTTDVTEFLEFNTSVPDEEILSENLNLEHLVKYDLVASQNKLKSLLFCLAYLKNLVKATHLQPTALGPAILSITTSDLKQIHFWNFCLSNPFASKQCLIYKGYCLMQLGFLARNNGQSWDTIQLFLAAKEIFLAVPDQRALGYCLDYLGDQYIDIGQLTTAENVLEDAIQVSSKLKDHGREAAILITLAKVKILTGKLGARELLAKSQKYFWNQGNWYMAYYTQYIQAVEEYYYGNCERAKHHLEACIAYGQGVGKQDFIVKCLLELSGMMLEAREYQKANKLLDKARSLSLEKGNLYGATMALGLKAVMSSDQQDFITAQEQMNIAISESSQDGYANEASMCCTYCSARNYLLAGQYTEAKNTFMKAIEISEALMDVRKKARSLRGIGEIAVLEDDLEAAKKLFIEAKSLCNFMGITPEFLHQGPYYQKLDNNRFHGWGLFQEGKLSSTQSQLQN